MPARFGSAALAVLMILAGCGKPQPTGPSLDDQAKLLELRKMCADQAALAFRSANYPRRANVLNTYTNHYSTKLGRCFIMVSIYDSSNLKNASTYETVEDAFEGRRLGSFFVQNTPEDAGHVDTCEETPAGRSQKSCTSKAEWDAYKALYMEAP